MRYCSQNDDGTVGIFNSAILPVIVAPSQSQVISLAPEFITPQDGFQKQDSEVAAAKRWISNYASEFKNQPVTLLGDDLYSHQPMAEHCLESGMNFIFTCLPESHTALYDWLDYLDGIGEVKTLETSLWHKRSKEIYHYRYVNQIPLRDTQPALRVNWCELTLIRQSDGKVLYQNAFITHHELTAVGQTHLKYKNPLIARVSAFFNVAYFFIKIHAQQGFQKSRAFALLQTLCSFGTDSSEPKTFSSPG